MMMDVHQRGIVRRDLYLEHAHVFIFERQVMTRLGGDLDLGGLLRSQGEGGEYQGGEYQTASHESRF